MGKVSLYYVRSCGATFDCGKWGIFPLLNNEFANLLESFQFQGADSIDYR